MPKAKPKPPRRIKRTAKATTVQENHGCKVVDGWPVPKPNEPTKLVISKRAAGWPEMEPGNVVWMPDTDPTDQFVAAVKAYADYRDAWDIHDFAFQQLGPAVKLANQDVCDALMARITRAAEDLKR